MLEKINNTELIDIRTVAVEKSLSQNERLIEYVRQIKNPYHFKCGECTFTAIYPENTQPFVDCLRGAIT